MGEILHFIKNAQNLTFLELSMGMNSHTRSPETGVHLQTYIKIPAQFQGIIHISFSSIMLTRKVYGQTVRRITNWQDISWRRRATKLKIK